jgi:protein O-GlcNAc transferase
MSTIDLNAAVHALRSGANHEALKLAESQLSTSPDAHDALLVAALAAKALGMTERAIEFWQRYIHVHPGSVMACISLANLYHSVARLQEAEAAYRQALRIDPRHVDALYNLGLLLKELGQADASVLLFQKALEIQPEQPDVWCDLGISLYRTGRAKDAESAYAAGIRIAPNDANLHYHLALLYSETQRPELAEASFLRALDLSPDHFGTLNNLAVLLKQLRRFDEAERLFLQALSKHPDHAVHIHFNLALLYQSSNRLSAAARQALLAVDLDAGHIPALMLLGNLARDARDYQAAAEYFRRVIMLKPNDGEAIGQALFCARMCCDWSNSPAEEIALVDALRRGVCDIPTLLVLALTQASAQDQRQAAKQRTLITQTPLAPPPQSQHDVLHIGYLSADFHDHATMYLLGGVLREHDRSRIKVHGYSYGPEAADTQRQLAAESCDTFRDIRTLDDRKAAQLILEDGIDILVDLKGFTQHARPGITQLRPAPIIVNWLGYPGTLGHRQLADYIIGDPIVTPLAHADDFSETLALLPHCYQPNDSTRQIGSVPTRQEVGLPESAFVFCSFNQAYKLNPETFDVWCRLLHEAPRSVLWILKPGAPAEDNLRREASLRGITPERIIFASKMPLAEHLGRLQLADLALDTFPYTSHTTGSDALWAGVPLVTRTGDTFASRVAASLLLALDMPELIASCWDDYFVLAKTLATQPDKLSALKIKLSAHRHSHPLFDTRTFTKDLERLYRAIWQHHIDGNEEPIIIKDDSPTIQR